MATIIGIPGVVCGRCQSGGPGANDDQVAHMRLIDSFIEPETVGNFFIGWISQHGSAATDQNGQVINRKRKAINHYLDFGITLEIDVGIGLVIAGQKLLDAQGVKRMAGAK